MPGRPEGTVISFRLFLGPTKRRCSSCGSIISPTKESITRIQKISITHRFLVGTPLGIAVFNLWLVALQPIMAGIVFIA